MSVPDPKDCMPWKIRFMKDAVKKGLIGEDVPVALFWNLSEFERQLKDLADAFPSHFTHMVATKANPLERMLKAGREYGAGAETASIGELQLALGVHEPKRIMLDSPTKTRKEITTALKAGVGLTIDNIVELERVSDLIAELRAADPAFALASVIGIRINPQIGVGLVATMSVSKAYGKFGVPIEQRAELLAAYARYPWLNMVHVHAGSQSYQLETIAGAIRIATDLALEVNRQAGRAQVTTMDIGGGLITNFGSEDNTPCFREWAAVLKGKVPELFTGQFSVITEYGRRLVAKQGVIVSKVEYTKVAGGRRVVLQHAGADLAVRTVYKPESWPLRVTAFDRTGKVFAPVKCYSAKEAAAIVAAQRGEQGQDGAAAAATGAAAAAAAAAPGAAAGTSECKSAPAAAAGAGGIPMGLLKADIAGPCCLDDVLEPRERDLPDVQEGDFIMLHDTGGYYHSSWSFYNCRQFPALYCFREPADAAAEVVFEEIRPMGSIDDTVAFFKTASGRLV